MDDRRATDGRRMEGGHLHDDSSSVVQQHKEELTIYSQARTGPSLLLHNLPDTRFYSEGKKKVTL